MESSGPISIKQSLRSRTASVQLNFIVLRAKEGIDPRFSDRCRALPRFHRARSFRHNWITTSKNTWHRISEFELPNFTLEEQSEIADLTWTTHNSLLACEEAIDAGTNSSARRCASCSRAGCVARRRRRPCLGLCHKTGLRPLWASSATMKRVASRLARSAASYTLMSIRRMASQWSILSISPAIAINHDNLPRFSDERASTLSRHRLQPGDILFARRGEIGRLGLAGPDETSWVCGTGCFLVRVHNEGIDNSFLTCLFGSVGAVAWLESNAAGAIMPNLNNTVWAVFPSSTRLSMSNARSSRSSMRSTERSTSTSASERSSKSCSRPCCTS